MRYLVIIGGIIATLFVLAAILLAVMVDPNKYKDDVAKLVKEKTGRELVFEGDVKLSFFPRLGVATGGMRLSNPPGFGDKPFTRLAAANVSIKILPLLYRRVEIGRVNIEGLELQLERDEGGRASWADFLGPDEPPTKNGEAQKPAAASGPSSLANLSLDGVLIKDARLTYDDHLTNKRYEVTNANVEIKRLRPGQPSDFTAAFDVVASRPEVSAHAELSGTATLNAGEDRHVFTNLALKIAASGKSVPGGKGEFTLGLADLKLDFKQQTASGGGLSLGAYGAKGTGQFLVTNLREAPDVKGRIDFADFNGRELSAALTGKPSEALGTADASAYQHISGGLEFRFGTGYTEIPTLKINLDDALVEGRLRSTGLDKKAYNFNLHISGLDADRFLPAKKDGAEAAKAEKPGAAGEPGIDAKSELFPVKSLREMRLDGQITAERLKFKGLRFASLKVPMMAQDGVLDIGPVEARLYEGSLKSHTRVDAQGDRPVVTQSLSLAGVQAKPLFSDLNGRESQFAGVLTVDTVSPLVGQGNSEFALKRSLNGRVRFSVKDGVFPGVNMVGVVEGATKKAKDALTGEAATGEGKSTKFGSIEGTAAIVNGVASINDLEMKAPFLRAEGQGTVDLATKHTDYTLRTRLVASAEGQGGGDSLGILVPIRITGPYDNLSYGTDYLRAIGKGALDAVGGVVKGIGEALTGKKGADGKKKSGGLLDGVKKLF